MKAAQQIVKLDNAQGLAIPSIGEEDARTLVDRIRAHIVGARKLVLELYEKRGWEALGYVSWRDCVSAEFGQSQSRVYQLLDAAKVEHNISTMVENNSPIAERVLRPLARLKPEQQRQIWTKAVERSETGEPTAKEIKAVAERERIRHLKKTAIAKVLKAFEASRISLRQAERIAESDPERQLELLAVTEVVRVAITTPPTELLRQCIEACSQKIRILIEQAEAADQENLLQALAAELNNQFPEAILLLLNRDGSG